MAGNANPSKDQPQLGYIENEQQSDQELLRNFLAQMDDYAPAVCLSFLFYACYSSNFPTCAKSIV